MGARKICDREVVELVRSQRGWAFVFSSEWVGFVLQGVFNSSGERFLEII